MDKVYILKRVKRFNEDNTIDSDIVALYATPKAAEEACARLVLHNMRGSNALEIHKYFYVMESTVNFENHVAGKTETTGWQPIATAPRDGTEVDLWFRPYTGRCRRLTDMWWNPRMGWRNGDLSTVIPAADEAKRVTHWRQPPEAPHA